MPDLPSNPISFQPDAASGDTVSFAHGGGQSPTSTTSPEQTLSMAQWTLRATEGGAVNLPPALQNIPAGPSFKMRRVVGRGGFGEVWEAVQSSLGRVVAVKKLADMHYATVRDDEDQLKRLENEFRQEALTAAGLDHPNIVPVYDLGFDQQGHPLLAMKLVRGTPWDTLVANEFYAVPAAEFLGKHIPILIDVAQAVAFAHSRGIAHRDLKPSQVMVGSYGEVMLMDWGLAMMFDKDAIAGALEPEALRFASTRETASSPCGTPAYMAPEQTERTAANVGPWTDVFLLGATLYQLLTGQPPYADRSAQSAFERAARMDFRAPATVAPGREIPAELLELAMTAMKREPKERVPSANDFVKGLQDFLSGAGKRREAQQLVSAATEQLARKPLDYRGLSKILADLDRAMGLWPAVPGGAELHVAALEDYARTAVAGGDLLLARLQAELLPAGRNRDNLIQDIELQSARARAVKQQRRVFLVASIVLLIAVCVSIGVYSNKLKHERDAAERARGDAVVAKNEAVSERDRAEKARLNEEDARQRAEGLMDFMMSDLRTGLEAMGRLDLLDKVARESLEYYTREEPDPSSRLVSQRVGALNNLSSVLLAQGNAAESLKSSSAALASATRALTSNPDDAGALLGGIGANLQIVEYHLRTASVAEGVAYMEDASRLMERLRAVEGETTPTLLLAAKVRHLEYLAGLYGGDYEQAETASTEGIRILENLVGDARQDPEPVTLLCGFYNGRGDALIGANKAAEAIPFYEKSVAAAESALEGNPLDVNLLTACTTALGRIGYVQQFILADLEAALEANRRGLEINEALVSRNPTNVTFQRDYSIACALMGLVLDRMERPAEAIVHLRKSRDVAKLMAQIDANNMAHYTELAGRHKYVADAAKKLELLDEAEEEYKNALEIGEQLYASGELKRCAETAGRRQVVNDIATCGVALSNIQYELGLIVESEVPARRALEFAALNRRDPENPRIALTTMALAHIAAARSLPSSGRGAEALPLLEEARELLEPVTREDGLPVPDSNGMLGARVLSTWTRILGARAKEEMGDHPEALQDLESSLPAIGELQSTSMKTQADLMEIEVQVRLGESARIEHLLEPLADSIRKDPILTQLLEEKAGFKLPPKPVPADPKPPTGGTANLERPVVQ